jgi:hypothetical protein
VSVRADNVDSFYSGVPKMKPVNFRGPQRAGSCTANPMPRDDVDSQQMPEGCAVF